MEQAYFGASQLLNWLNRIHTDRNREQFNELYSKLSEHLSILFQHWCNFSSPDLLYKIIELLSSRSPNNLFEAVMQPESLNFYHPFPFTQLPIYVQKILKTRRLSDLPQFYKMYQIVMDKGIIVLPTSQYFLFTFMAESCKNRHADWFEGCSFLEYVYNDPFLLVFSHYLQDLEEDMLKYLTVLVQEYIIKDAAYREVPAPSRHNCEMLLILVYTLQKPSYLLLPSFRIVNINPEAYLLPLCEEFYKMFKNLCISWQPGNNTYCTYLIEVWLQILTPWKKNEILNEFLVSEFYLAPSKKTEKNHVGDEAYWEEYIQYNILLYTECFGLAIKLLCSEMLFRAGDINVLLKMSEIFTIDSEGNLFSGHLSLVKLKQWSKNLPLPDPVEAALHTFSVNRNVLFPFNDSNVTAVAENLIYKASSLGYPEISNIKKNWGVLLGIRNRVFSADGGKKHLRMNLNYGKSLLNVWEKPIRSDELFVLLWIVRNIAWGIDRARGKEKKWPPETDLRFFASYTNLLFLIVLYFVASYILS